MIDIYFEKENLQDIFDRLSLAVKIAPQNRMTMSEMVDLFEDSKILVQKLLEISNVK